MPSSSVRTFTEPDEYASAMRQATVEFTVMQRGDFYATLDRIELHRLWMQRFSANLACTSHNNYWGGHVTISFQTRPGPNISRGGRPYPDDSIARLIASQDFYLSSPGPASYGTVSVPLAEMAAYGVRVGDRDAAAPGDSLTLLTPSPLALAKLRRLHEAAGHLAKDAPEVLVHHEVARGIEQAVIEAMLGCLRDGEIEEDSAAQRQHAAIMRRFDRVIEGHLDEPLYVPELCKEVGASLRTLNTCCQEHLGIGPKHYLLLRRMHMVRRTLRQSAPADTTVTEVSARYGFWQLGRLAVEYKALFGESPSATLARVE